MSELKRKPSASPVCYADEPGIDPAYMMAPKPAKAKRVKRRRKEAPKTRGKSR